MENHQYAPISTTFTSSIFNKHGNGNAVTHTVKIQLLFLKRVQLLEQSMGSYKGKTQEKDQYPHDELLKPKVSAETLRLV